MSTVELPRLFPGRSWLWKTTPCRALLPPGPLYSRKIRHCDVGRKPASGTYARVHEMGAAGRVGY